MKLGWQVPGLCIDDILLKYPARDGFQSQWKTCVFQLVSCFIVYLDTEPCTYPLLGLEIFWRKKVNLSSSWKHDLIPVLCNGDLE